MFKLLKVELKTLFKWKATKYTVVFLALLAALISGMNVLNEELALSGLFTFPAIVLMVVSAVGGLFMYQDYSQNTIRNKIIVGYSRLEIYTAKVLATLFLHFLSVFIFMFIFVGIGVAFLDTEYVVMEACWKNCINIVLSTCVISTFTSLLSINIQSPLGGLLPMMLVSATTFGSIFGAEILSVNGGEKIIELMASLPVTGLIHMSEVVVPNDLHITIISGACTILVFVIFGYLIFRKADLK
jgi:hypothetical protein